MDRRPVEDACGGNVLNSFLLHIGQWAFLHVCACANLRLVVVSAAWKLLASCWGSRGATLARLLRGNGSDCGNQCEVYCLWVS